MPPVNVLIKPASGSCNMRCRYCFYADETKKRAVENHGMMSSDLAEKIIIKSLEYAEQTCAFGFQGGEPTLRGIDFFRRFVSLVEEHNSKNIPVSLMLQTNGYLIDDEWADFFRSNNFLVGLSLDGDKDLHDLNRIDADGNGTFRHVVHTVELFERHKVEYNILSVVTAQSARHIQRIYRFFKKNGLAYQQYIPCLDPLGEERGQRPYSLTPQAYKDFLINCFDLWYADRCAGRIVYNRYFENLAGIMLGHPPESCGMSGICSRQLVVEADGSVYPCDFYMLDDYIIGNFNDCTIPEMEQRRDELGFIQASIDSLSACIGCDYANICRGGCRRDRQGLRLQELERNYYCEAYKAFFAHALPKLATLIH